MAGVKITDLELMTEAASDDLLYIVDVSDNTSGPEGTSKAIEVRNVAVYKEWVGLLNSTIGTDMTIIILSNNLGESINVTYDSGVFTITKTTNFNFSKTVLNIGTSINSYPIFQSKSVGGCDFNFIDVGGSPTLLQEYIPIFVRIYP